MNYLPMTSFSLPREITVGENQQDMLTSGRQIQGKSANKIPTPNLRPPKGLIYILKKLAGVIPEIRPNFQTTVAWRTHLDASSIGSNFKNLWQTTKEISGYNNRSKIVTILL